MIKSIKTKYKGIQFKSILEARTALVLDYLEFNWQYEKESFILNNGNSYIPDFTINKSLIIEAKGIITEEQKEFHLEVSKQLNKDILLISLDESFFIDGTTEYYEDNKIKTIEPFIDISYQLLNCSDCKKNSFITSIGHFFCRNCGSHNGDHDCIDYFHSYGINDFYNHFNLYKYKK